MADIIKLMKTLGLNPNEKGVCLGLAFMSTLAFLPGHEQHQKLIKRFSAIQSLNLNSQEELNKLTQDKELDLYTFLEGVQLFQSSGKYAYLVSDTHKYNVKFQDISSLIQSKAIEEEGGAQEVAAFTGVYSSFELYHYLLSFQSICEQHENTPRISLLLGSSVHMIMVAYQAENKAWLIHNYGNTQITNNPQIAAVIIANSLFWLHSKTIVTYAYSTKKQASAADEIIKRWQQTPFYKTLHEVTAHKAGIMDSHFTRWIHLACRIPQNHNIVKNLIQAGADLNARIYFGHSPVHTAAINDNPKAVEHLIKGGADLFQLSYSGHSALYFAVYYENIDCLQKIISAKPETVFDILHFGELNLNLPSGICNLTIKELALMLACKTYNKYTFHRIYPELNKQTLPDTYNKVTRVYTNPTEKKRWLYTETLKFELHANSHASMKTILFFLQHADLSKNSGRNQLTLGQLLLILACVRKSRELFQAIYPHLKTDKLNQTVEKVLANFIQPESARQWVYREMVIDDLKLDNKQCITRSGQSFFQYQEPKETEASELENIFRH